MHLNVRGDPLLKTALKSRSKKKSYDLMIIGTCHKDLMDTLQDWLYTLKLVRWPDTIIDIDFREIKNNPIHLYQDQVAYEVLIRRGGVK